MIDNSGQFLTNKIQTQIPDFRKTLSSTDLLNAHITENLSQLHNFSFHQATMPGKVQLSEEETREEGNAVTAGVTGEDNTNHASCPHPWI